MPRDPGDLHSVQVRVLEQPRDRLVAQIVKGQPLIPAAALARCQASLIAFPDIPNTEPSSRRGRDLRTATASRESGTVRAVLFLVTGRCALRCLRSMLSQVSPAISPARMAVANAHRITARRLGGAAATRSAAAAPGL